MTAIQKLDELRTIETEKACEMELNKMGWHKQPCEHCQGEGSYVVHVSQFPDRLADDQKIMCQHCKGFGFKWVGPEEKK